MPQTMRNLIEKYIIEIQKVYGLHLRKIILYGSYARGDFRPDSDVDVMILLDISDLELKKYSQQLSYMTYDFNLDHDIDIKPIARSGLENKVVVKADCQTGISFSYFYSFYKNVKKCFLPLDTSPETYFSTMSVYFMEQSLEFRW